VRTRAQDATVKPWLPTAHFEYRASLLCELHPRVGHTLRATSFVKIASRRREGAENSDQSCYHRTGEATREDAEAWTLHAIIGSSPRLRIGPAPITDTYVVIHPTTYLTNCPTNRPSACAMKYSAADPSVHPHKQLGLIVPWTVFNLLACAAFAALFVGLVCGPVARRTPVLVSLYAVFVLATAAGPMLSWTGRVMTPEVPVPLCVVSAAFGSSWSLTQVSAAFALVLNVRVTVPLRENACADRCLF
jgi:hypothetical protein